GVAPDDGLPGLIFQLREDFLISTIIHSAFEFLPIARALRNAVRTVVMRIVERLNHGLPGVQLIRIRDVMHEKHEIVRTILNRLVELRYGRRILPHKSGSGRNGPIESNTFRIGLVPLSPAVPLRSLNGNPEVIPNDIGQRLEAKRARVVLISAP